MSLSFGSGPFGSDPGVPPPTAPTATVTVFAKPLNYHDLLPPIVLTAPHAAGAATLVLSTGAGARLGTLPANRIFRVTALRFPGTTAEQVLGIFKAPGIDGDTLTDVSGDEGFGNVALATGTTIEVRATARDLGEIQDAVNAAEATLAGNTTAISAHVADAANPHAVTKAQVGLGSVDDTADAAKPVSAATQAALAGKQPLDADLTALAGLSHARGQLIADDGSAWVALAPGTDSQVLTLDSTTASGVKWATPSAGGTPGGPADAIQTNDGAGGFAGPAHARVNAAGSLKIDGQAGEYPIEVFTPDGLTSIFRVVNTTGDVFSAGTYSSADGFQVTAFGAYVGVAGANRLTFLNASPTILAHPLSASQSVFGVQGASGQTAPLMPLMGYSSTGTPRDLGYVDGGFVVATDASFTGYLDVDANDFAGRRKGLRVASDGTQALIGAFGATPVAKPSGDVAAGLAALGWIGSPTYAASSITGSIPESQVTGLTTDLAAKAPTASPTFTGTPAAPTAAVDTSTTQVATAAFVLGQAASATPLIDGTAAAGTSTRYARGDHVHPTDTTRAPLASPALTGTPTAPTAAFGTATTQLATTAFVLANTDVNGRLTATVTTTSSTLGTNALTGLGFAIGAGEVWTVEWNLTVTGSTAGMKFDVTGPASPADLRISIVGNTSAITATSAETITAFSTASAAYVLYATTSGQVRIVACINNGANAGTVQLRFGSATNTQSNSVLIDSYMTARRIG
jgi:hypothetical protein